jgi:hypothetical protein
VQCIGLACALVLAAAGGVGCQEAAPTCADVAAKMVSLRQRETPPDEPISESDLFRFRREMADVCVRDAFTERERRCVVDAKDGHEALRCRSQF